MFLLPAPRDYVILHFFLRVIIIPGHKASPLFIIRGDLMRHQLSEIPEAGTSLVVQWLGTCVAVQGACVRSLAGR